MKKIILKLLISLLCLHSSTNCMMRSLVRTLILASRVLPRTINTSASLRPLSSRSVVKGLARISFAGSAQRRNFMTSKFKLAPKSNGSSNNNALVTCAPEFSADYFGKGNIVKRSAADYRVSSFGIMYSTQEQVRSNYAKYTYVATSNSLSAEETGKPKTVILIQNQSNVLEEFKKLTPMLQKEVVRDMNQIGEFFMKSTYKRSLSNSPQDALPKILSQFTQELRDYYSTMISNLASSHGFLDLDCINMHTSFQCASDKPNVITRIETHIVGNKLPAADRQCCANCKQNKIDGEQKSKIESLDASEMPILLPASFESPYEVLQISKDALPEEARSKLFALRRENEKSNQSKEWLERFESAYNQIKNKQLKIN